MYQLWTKAKRTALSTEPRAERKCQGCHYKSDITKQWSNVTKAKVSVYKDAQEKQYVTFNVNPNSWFAKENLNSSSWTDMTPQIYYKFFSIDGLLMKEYKMSRRFYIARSFAGCAHDYGWLMIGDIYDKSTGCGDLYEKGQVPFILYSQDTTSRNFIGMLKADALVIFVRLSDLN